TPRASVTFGEIIEQVGKAVDAAGVVVVVAGLGWATASFIARGLGGGMRTYREYRQRIGRAILLGLELLVAGDIIRTVAVSPSFRSAGVLAVIVFIRTFLSASLQVELDGRFPWQRKTAARNSES